jgi:hypothetical protein
MKLSLLSIAVASVVVVVGALLTSSAALEGGGIVEYKFSSPPLHALGIQSMAELRGKPVVIDFWGRN